jgi:hypothetical protein
MTTYRGKQTVKGGYFLNLRDWKLEVVEGHTGVLPGDADARYRRVPMFGMLLVAPLMGLLFVILLPFIGLAVIGERLVKMAAAYRVKPAARPEPKATTNPLR